MKVLTGNRLQSIKTNLHSDQRSRIPFINFMFCKRERGAFLKCIIYESVSIRIFIDDAFEKGAIIYESVSIRIFAQKRDEKVSFFNGTGIYGHTLHFFILNC